MRRHLIKVIAFDVDGTLLHRTVNQEKEVKEDARSNGRFLYYRPHLDYLAKNMQSFNERTRVVICTSMKRVNAEKIEELLLNLGLRFHQLFTQEDWGTIRTKDLNIVARDYEVNVDEVMLVDDTPSKRLQEQNYLHIKTYDVHNSQDCQLIRVVDELKEMLPQVPFRGQSKRNPRKQPTEQISQKLEQKKSKPKLGKLLQYKEKESKNGQQEEQEQHTTKEVPPLNQKLKVIVFDLNKTLISKSKQLRPDIEKLYIGHKIKGQQVYLRPYIQLIRQFIHTHSNENLKFVVWTTMVGSKTTSQYLKMFREHGLNFDEIIDGKYSSESKGKDLKIVCERFGAALDNVILVDDSPYKRVQEQHFILGKQFRGDLEDDGLIEIVQKLDEFIGCSAQCEIKKIKEALAVVQKLKAMQYYQKEQQQQQKTITSENQANDTAQPPKNKKNKNQNKQGPGEKKEKKKQFNPNELQRRDTANDELEQEDFGNIRTFYHNSQPGEISQNPPAVKCLVFDINQTLLTRDNKHYERVEHDSTFKHYYNYLRPHLETLTDFISSRQPELKVCLWTTIKYHNSNNLKNLLKQKRGLVVDHLFTQEDLVEGKKDLRLVADKYKIAVQEIVLIDDSRKKRVQGQNFVQIKSFVPSCTDDSAILSLVEQLNKIVSIPKISTQRDEKVADKRQEQTLTQADNQKKEEQAPSKAQQPQKPQQQKKAEQNEEKST